jgi:hypothetical protein
MKPRTGQSEKERKARSRLHFLLRSKGLLRGSLVTLKTKCGNPNCRCSRGEKHRSRVVEQHRGGKTRMRTVRPEQEEKVEQWIRNFREAQALLDELSEIHWQKLEEEKKKK